MSLCPVLPLSNGRTIPAVGFGTWRADTTKIGEALLTALRAGVRHIDTAGIYRNEALLGSVIKSAIDEGVCSREELFVTSKLGMGQMTPELVRPAIEQSIADLGIGYLDLYLTVRIRETSVLTSHR